MVIVFTPEVLVLYKKSMGVRGLGATNFDTPSDYSN